LSSGSTLAVLATLVVLPLVALAGTRYVTPEALQELLASENPPLVIDVRTGGEFVAGRVPGAINIPHTELKRRIPEVRTLASGTVAVYDQVGPRANRAQRMLSEAGFNDILHLEGGYENWKRRGFPVER